VVTDWWKRRNDVGWRNAWRAQRDAFAILISHFETLLEQEQVRRIDCLDREFNPAIMNAVHVVNNPRRPDNWVVEECVAGYLHRDELLRPAQVTVNKKN